MKSKVVCIREIYDFKVGEKYDYWTNFGGLNHIVSGDGPFPFRGEPTPDDNYIWDFFIPLDEWRVRQINKLEI